MIGMNGQAPGHISHPPGEVDDDHDDEHDDQQRDQPTADVEVVCEEHGDSYWTIVTRLPLADMVPALSGIEKSVSRNTSGSRGAG